MDDKYVAYGSEKLTQAEVRRMNRKQIFRYIYNSKSTSKQAIATALNLSLPTVSQNINLFMEQGLVKKAGVSSSTGGRKAELYCCDNLSRVAIGVELLKEGAEIVAIDLYGSILQKDSFPVPFENTDDYFQKFGKWVNRFSSSLPFPESKLLGVNIAIQGLVSGDGEYISYSEILNSTGLQRSMYQKHISLPCSIIHDTDASAIAEIWQRPDLVNAIYLVLNRNFGGILIINGQVFKGHELSSGTIEHMCLSPNGPLCYCGKRGCLETYCSANSLQAAAGLELSEFFSRVRKGDCQCSQIWEEFMHNLALAIDNIRMVIDCDFILGGYLLSFMNQDDFNALNRYVQEQCAFESKSFSIEFSQYGNDAPKIGAGIALIQRFFDSL